MISLQTFCFKCKRSRDKKFDGCCIEAIVKAVGKRNGNVERKTMVFMIEI